MWGVHVDYIMSTLGLICVMWQAYLLRAYDNNVKWIFTIEFADIVDYSMLIWGIYTDILVSYLYMK